MWLSHPEAAEPEPVEAADPEPAPEGAQAPLLEAKPRVQPPEAAQPAQAAEPEPAPEAARPAAALGPRVVGPRVHSTPALLKSIEPMEWFKLRLDKNAHRFQVEMDRKKTVPSGLWDAKPNKCTLAAASKLQDHGKMPPSAKFMSGCGRRPFLQAWIQLTHRKCQDKSLSKF